MRFKSRSDDLLIFLKERQSEVNKLDEFYKQCMDGSLRKSFLQRRGSSAVTATSTQCTPAATPLQTNRSARYVKIYFRCK